MKDLFSFRVGLDNVLVAEGTALPGEWPHDPHNEAHGFMHAALAHVERTQGAPRQLLSGHILYNGKIIHSTSRFI